jgi:nucleoside transporter
MSMSIRVQLSVMMFVQFFVWGAWFVTMGNYLGAGLGFEGSDIGRAYSTTGYAAILSPLFVGMIADRFFSAQKVMGILHLLGAGLMYWSSTITTPGMFFWVLLAYAMCYMPTLALVNSISFNQMTNPEKEFPGIRVAGTLGWIVAGLFITFLGARMGYEGIEATSFPFKIAAIASFVMGVLSFTLPDTPPKGAGEKASIIDLLGLDALALMKDRSFAIFAISSLLICIPLAFYYSFANLFLNDSGMTGVAAKMTMGQMSEVIFMVLMPFFFSRLGVKKMLLLGMLAWVIRYALFAYGNSDSLIFMFYGGILIHGICYDFFFVTGQIYVDKEAPENMRSNAQGFIALITYGVGMVIGNEIAGRWVGSLTEMVEKTVDGEVMEVAVYNWQSIWLMPTIMAFVIVIGFALLFKDPVNGGEAVSETTE